MKQNTIDFLKEKEANNSRLNITALLVCVCFVLNALLIPEPIINRPPLFLLNKYLKDKLVPKH